MANNVVIGIDASRAITGQRTGTEAYAYFLIQALITQSKQPLRLYFNQPPPPGLFSGEFEAVHIPFSRLWTHIRLAWELHRRPPDLFFTPAHVIPFTYFGRSVATIHDVGYHHFPKAHPTTQLAYLRWSTAHNTHRSQLVIADSQATKDDLRRFYGTNPAKIAVVYPGIDPQLQPVRDESQITAVLHTYHITRPYLLYISTLQPRKNLVRLVEAYAASGLPHQLVLAGKTGWLSQPILQTIANLPPAISQNILLPGFIPDAHKAALLSGATALLYPSLYEGFGFPALEAQACGTAVLCANTSSLPEIVGDGALLVNPLETAEIAAAMQHLATDAPVRQTLVQKGFENVKRFSWQKTAEHLLALLEQIANGASDK